MGGVGPGFAQYLHGLPADPGEAQGNFCALLFDQTGAWWVRRCTHWCPLFGVVAI